MTDHSPEILAVALQVGQLQNHVDWLQVLAHLSRFDQRRYQRMTAELITERTRLENMKRDELAKHGAR